MPESRLQRSRNAAVTLWHTPDRLIHPIRRRAARNRLEQADLPIVILFICHGNICRSAYAARALMDRWPADAGGLVTAHSAGFVGPGRPSPPEALQVAAARMVDLSGHRSQTLTHEMLRRSDLVITMDARQRRAVAAHGAPRDSLFVLGDLDPLGIRKRGIMDPYRRPVEVFESVFDRLDRCLHELISSLLPSALQPSPAGESSAPSRRPFSV